MAELKPAIALAREASRPYPNDSAAYRTARTALLAEEIELRRHIERVAEQRRALPPGGDPPQDYRFTDHDGVHIGLADLFGPHDTLVLFLDVRAAACTSLPDVHRLPRRAGCPGA